MILQMLDELMHRGCRRRYKGKGGALIAEENMMRILWEAI